jgi:hypothetical protein
MRRRPEPWRRRPRQAPSIARCGRARSAVVALRIERLADRGDVAVPEDRPDAGEDRHLFARRSRSSARPESAPAPAPPSAVPSASSSSQRTHSAGTQASPRVPILNYLPSLLPCVLSPQSGARRFRPPLKGEVRQLPTERPSLLHAPTARARSSARPAMPRSSRPKRPQPCRRSPFRRRSRRRARPPPRRRRSYARPRSRARGAMPRPREAPRQLLLRRFQAEQHDAAAARIVAGSPRRSVARPRRRLRLELPPVRPDAELVEAARTLATVSSPRSPCLPAMISTISSRPTVRQASKTRRSSRSWRAFRSSGVVRVIEAEALDRLRHRPQTRCAPRSPPPSMSSGRDPGSSTGRPIQNG